MEANMRNRIISVILWVLIVACFALFLWHERLGPRLPPAGETKAAFNVGLPASPWLSYKTDEGRPLSNRFSGFEIRFLSASWLLLLVALAASFGISLLSMASKTQPTRVVGTSS
jgi:hypothetical protein